MDQLMQEYQQVKSAHPDCLLFFRSGDFYELFFDDAVVAARALDITLTKRGQDVPMAGVPVHSHEAYLDRLIRQGHRVAICERVELPTKTRKTATNKFVRVISGSSLVQSEES